MSWVCRQPPGLLRIPTRGPRPRSERGSDVDRPKPTTAIAGGEGGVGENGEHAKADLRVYWERRVRVGGGRSAVGGGRRSGGGLQGGDGAPEDNSGGNRADEDQ